MKRQLWVQREGPAVALHGRLTSNNGTSYRQADTAGQCHNGTKCLVFDDLYY